MTRLSNIFPGVSIRDVYKPAAAVFDNAGDTKKINTTLTGNKFTFTCRFKVPAFTDSNQYRALFSAAPTDYCPLVAIRDDTNAAAAERKKLYVLVENSSSTAVCQLLSTVEVADDAWHTLFFSYDGDNGTAVFLVDGVDADDTGYSNRVAPTTGTLEASGDVYIGTLSASLPRRFSGQIQYVGYSLDYLTADSYSKFFNVDKEPVIPDTVGWSQWGGNQPLLFAETGDGQNNKGSLGAFTLTGAFSISDPEIVETGFVAAS